MTTDITDDVIQALEKGNTARTELSRIVHSQSKYIQLVDQRINLLYRDLYAAGALVEINRKREINND